MSLKQMQILDSTEAVKQERPEPCARHCEANAFQIVIKNLKAQLAQPEQEPVACKHEWFRTGAMEPKERRCIKCGTFNTTPTQRTEQCNYPDCKCPTENPCLKGLAQPEQEPVIDKSAAIRIATSLGWEPKRPWVGLTDDEIDNIYMGAGKHDLIRARKIEAKLKEKNT